MTPGLMRAPSRFGPERVESWWGDFYGVRMAQSLAKVLMHVVYSTKERRPFLRDRAMREEVHSYLGGILNQMDCQPLIVGGVEDHVHLLCVVADLHDR
jgi:REP element-mobilizing transposase RayT